ncbi:MAG: GIY-YIG nuclease family protein [Thermoplasmata archaeon]
MAARAQYGWDLDPTDARGVVRGRTKLGQLTIWVIPAEPMRAVIDDELGKGLQHPGLYVLFDDETDRAYVGESSNLKARLNQHLDKAPKELGRFDRALILNDGRAAVHSRFNDSTLREALEQATIKMFHEGGSHALVNQQKRMPELSVAQQTIFESLRNELGHVLYELEFITGRPRPTIDIGVIRPQDAAARFPAAGITDIKGYEGRSAGQTVFFRKGSEKPQGLQVTIRVGEPFGKAVVAGEGLLCMNRGRCYLIPNAAVKAWLGAKLENQTVDIFLDVEAQVLKTADIEPMAVDQFGAPKASKA